MNLKEAVAKIRELEAKIKTLEGKARTRSQLEFSENQGSLTDFATVLKGRFDELEKTVESLSISGATFAKGGAFQAALTDSIKSLDEFAARGDLGAKAVEALAKDIEQFEKLTRLAGETTSNLAGDLSTQAALLNQLGLSYGEFSKNLDIAIYSFGMTASGVKNINLEIKELANQVNMLPATVSRNFQRVSQNLAYDFKKITEQFVALQSMAAKTGVSVDTLMGKFGRPMDTISGASDMAARLNALLGRNAFSATELLMMDEATRAESIRSALTQSGAAQTAMSGGVRGKFALQSIQEVLGMSVDETRRFLQGGGIKQEMAAKIGEAGEVGDLANNFRKPAKSLEEALKDLTQTIRTRQMNTIERQLVAARENALRNMDNDELMKELIEGQQKLFIGGAIGKDGAKVTTAELAKAAMKDPTVLELAQLAQSGALDDTEMLNFKKLITAMNAGDEKAQIKLRQQLSENMALGQGLSSADLMILKRTPEFLGAKIEMMNFLRTKPDQKAREKKLKQLEGKYEEGGNTQKNRTAFFKNFEEGNNNQGGFGVTTTGLGLNPVVRANVNNTVQVYIDSELATAKVFQTVIQ